MSRWLALLLVAGSAFACNGDDGAQTQDEAAAPDTGGDDNHEARAEKARQEKAAEAECKVILDKAWGAVLPALARLDIDRSPALEKAYKADAGFLARCKALSGDARACLRAADDPITGIGTCGVNKGTRAGDRLYPPDLRRYAAASRPPALDDEEAADALDDAVGRWVRESDRAEVWVIEEDGDLEITRGDDDETEYEASFDVRGRLTLRAEGREHHYAFVQIDRRTLYASDNLVHGAYPYRGRRDVEVHSGGDSIFYDGDACEVVSREGVLADAQCDIVRDGYDRYFEASYSLPYRTYDDGRPVPQKARFVIDGRWLIHADMAACCEFERR